MRLIYYAMNYTLSLLLVVTLTSCSTLTDYLLKDEQGTHVDIQAGSNENKVKTGIGSLGLDKETSLTIEDSQHIDVKNSDNRYKITTTGDTHLNVYETNYWLYAIFAVYLLGKPLLKTLWLRRDKNNWNKYIDNLADSSRAGVRGNDRNNRRSS